MKPENEKDSPLALFEQWAIDNKVRFLESEKHVYSREMWIGGILDCLIELDGKLWLMDIKTGSGIYAEAFYQMSAYDLCFQEMGAPAVEGYIVVNLPKTGGIKEKRSISNEDYKLAFRSALNLYRVGEKIKNTIL